MLLTPEAILPSQDYDPMQSLPGNPVDDSEQFYRRIRTIATVGTLVSSIALAASLYILNAQERPTPVQQAPVSANTGTDEAEVTWVTWLGER